jgi:hypothetical protein
LRLNHSNPQTKSHQKPATKIRSMIGSRIATLVRNWMNRSKPPTTTLPIHESPSPTDTSKQPVQLSSQSIEFRYLLLCMNDSRFRYAPRLLQRDIASLRTDWDLFAELRHAYKTTREKWTSFLSMHTLKEIIFVRVSRQYNINCVNLDI